MNNLVIGNTSQLSHYFPDDYIKISSRNINMDVLCNRTWGSVYITFAEQNIYSKYTDFITPNYLYTLKIIQSLLHKADRIVCYTTCSLWSKASGFINIDTPPNFDLDNEYTMSKFLLWNKIKELRKLNPIYNKVIFIHPFRFISRWTSKYFLLGEIIDSIINKKKIKVGSIDIYRDLSHAKTIADASIRATEDKIVGSGKLFNIKDFIRDLYKRFGMNFNDYVIYNHGSTKQELIMVWSPTEFQHAYEILIEDLYNDICNQSEVLSTS